MDVKACGWLSYVLNVFARALWFEYLLPDSFVGCFVREGANMLGSSNPLHSFVSALLAPTLFGLCALTCVFHVNLLCLLHFFQCALVNETCHFAEQVATSFCSMTRWMASIHLCRAALIVEGSTFCRVVDRNPSIDDFASPALASIFTFIIRNSNRKIKYK